MADEPLQPSPANNFVNPASAISFPAASGAITTTWQIAGKMSGSLGDQATWFPVLLAVIIGFCFYLAGDKPGKTWTERLPVMIAAFFNTVMLAAAALGLSQAAR